jgi:localization factor PodJL
VSLLATKVSEMAANEDRAIRSAVGSLERRLDTLADRIASQPAPVLPLNDLIARLDSIQSSLASARHEMPPGLEAMLRGLADRMERIERPEENLRLDVLGRQISELTQKIEKAVAGAEIAGQLASIERAVNDLFIQMEETRATFLATGSRPRPPAGGSPNGGTARIKREIAALEAEREAPPAAPMASASMPAAVAAPVEAAAPAVPEANFSPLPASIPKPFEPQLMRAALEELSRSAEAASLRGETAPAPEAVAAPEAAAATPLDDEFDFRPVDLDAQAAANAAARAAAPSVPNVARPAGPAAAPGAPNRAAFIAQARRATLPAGAGTPELRSHITERNRRQPTRWLARIRAMLLIGLCGSALAYGSWHFLAQMREQQLRAAAPAVSNTAKLPPAAKPTPPGSLPAPEDITGSVGKSAPRAQPPAQAPAEPPAAAPEAAPPAPAPIGPSSMSLPTELPGGIASQALRAAALAGDPAAAFEIARRFTDGEGVPPSPARAAEWLAYAAKNGSIPAAYRLGTIYEKGMDGVPRDVAKARQLYEQAANAGNVAAMHNLGVMLASGAAGQPDYRTAVTWFTLAAERGVRDSQYNLAVLYARGFGVTANPAEAWRWFALAAARGDGEAALKRDEVAAKIDARTLATLRSTVESWAPLMVDAKANDTPAVSWDDVPRKTASR